MHGCRRTTATRTRRPSCGRSAITSRGWARPSWSASSSITPAPMTSVVARSGGGSWTWPCTARSISSWCGSWIAPFARSSTGRPPCSRCARQGAASAPCRRPGSTPRPRSARRCTTSPSPGRSSRNDSSPSGCGRGWSGPAPRGRALAGLGAAGPSPITPSWSRVVRAIEAGDLTRAEAAKKLHVRKATLIEALGAFPKGGASAVARTHFDQGS